MNTFNVSFFIKKNKLNKNGQAPIYGRITVNGERAEFSTSRKINPTKWQSGQVKGKTIELKAIQAHLDTTRQRIYTLHTQILNEGKAITARVLKDKIHFRPKKSKTLIFAFQYYQKQLFEKGQTGTGKKYVTIQKHIEQFLKYQYSQNDIALDELNHQFIADFVHYLQTVGKISHNTSRRYMKQLKSVVHIAEKNEWIDKDPFKKFTMGEKPIKKVVLTEQELIIIEEKEIANERLTEVKDVFLFCCYTGLAYVDVDKLTAKEILTLPDGRKMIITYRTKTEEKAQIYLSEKAQQIIEKYKDHPVCQQKECLLPVKSNQKYNAYLKEIQVLCGIDKTLTTHVARRTHGTILLNNGVRLETVQQVLGHKHIEQTQEYAKMLNKTVADEVSKLEGKI